MRSWELKFDNEKLHTHLLRKFNQLGISQREQNAVSRSQLFRLRNGKPLMLDSLMKMVEYLDKDIGLYIYYTDKNGGKIYSSDRFES